LQPPIHRLPRLSVEKLVRQLQRRYQRIHLGLGVVQPE